MNDVDNVLAHIEKHSGEWLRGLPLLTKLQLIQTVAALVDTMCIADAKETIDEWILKP